MTKAAGPYHVSKEERRFWGEIDRLAAARDYRPDEAVAIQVQIDNVCIEYATLNPPRLKYNKFQIADIRCPCKFCEATRRDALGQLTGER